MIRALADAGPISILLACAMLVAGRIRERRRKALREAFLRSQQYRTRPETKGAYATARCRFALWRSSRRHSPMRHAAFHSVYTGGPITIRKFDRLPLKRRRKARRQAFLRNQQYHDHARGEWRRDSNGDLPSQE